MVQSNNGQQQTIGTCFTSTNIKSCIFPLCVQLEIIRATILDINCGLDPCDWGWQRGGDVLKPIRTDLPPTPDFLLRVIRYNCKTTLKNKCGSMLCTCRKNELTLRYSIRKFLFHRKSMFCSQDFQVFIFLTIP